MSDSIAVSAEYRELLDSVKQTIAAVRLRAARAVNTILVETYWRIGQDIITRQQEQGWGARVIERLSADLRSANPGVRGLSVRNLRYMTSLASREAARTCEGMAEACPQKGWSASINCMADPFAMAIATSVATKIADNLTEGARQDVWAIVRKVRDRLRSRPGERAEAAMLDAAVTSGDELAVAALARLLDALFVADPRFREEIEALWDAGSPDGSVTNVFHGKADKVIMMRDVHGDLTIN